MDLPVFNTLELTVDDDGIATLYLNRPEKMNAFNREMKDELLAAFDFTDQHDEVRAVIVTGKGRAFCAGADLSSGGDTFDYKKRGGEGANPDDAHRDGGGQVAMRIYRSLKPVIGAVNGAAVGVGITMQLPMDVRMASEDAKFGFVFSRRGIVNEAASSWFLSRVVGISSALEWCFTGRVFKADEAKERGLVRSLHKPEDLYPAAVALAKEMVEQSAPVSVAVIRQMIWRMAGAEHPMEAHKLDSKAMKSRGGSEDVKEGVMSFLEKRPAVFPDKVSRDLPDFFDWQGEPPFE
ncbi:crotonase/enoyl-CoA hydratase family protein [Alloalcanivorax profundimaris]|uniref:crotonase/enoyl-CoA hydratase family protein n=1 Tax=Alloalcanivorax profundimaris TaxID=2735259 RepID=UPI000C39932F|nr:crotonase/enoyl-CoA hydratase family protein [Alloalcanivorax profundimaris]MAO58307.1 enoyl-CoA hydratase [Alcanivorax sp.]MBM1142341.1 crotonase/enoyl-CoA hydratase family protein [Alcanivorax sp. ZXX171]MCQ6260309.1 crotonase/enoyl-CoA hydratase family protein [Alcanivorax sp. MM125-6]UWN50066.1 Short-chain-enoyl-CoA hydratase [Alcanivorax sp. ALC70]MBF1803325.1 crotonase/enoyl-CoA hydratase family protein [Alloalcanivorax profundimaris]|tara:strand:- start:5273 stop:6151 length:879 start_codon:yes stop_codon:yes gene_type:complete